jgi:hypothetical protein
MTAALNLENLSDNIKFCKTLTDQFKSLTPEKYQNWLRIINVNTVLPEITYMFRSEFKPKKCLDLLDSKKIELDILECEAYNAIKHNLGTSMVFKLKGIGLTDFTAFNNFFIQILQEI